MTKTIVMILGAAFMASGCGKSAGELTDTQRQTLKEFTSSTSRVSSAAKSNGVNPSEHTPSAARTSRITAALHIGTQTVSDDTAEKMSKILKDAVRENRCKVTSSHTALGSKVEFAGASNAFNFGDPKKDCPIYAKISSSNVTALQSTYEINFQALSDEFKELSEIDFVDFKVNFTFKVDSKKSELGTGKFSTKMEGSGTIRSRKVGAVTVGIRGEDTTLITATSAKSTTFNSTGKFETRLEFKDFAVELKGEYETSPEANKVKYVLNGKDATEAEVQEFFSGLAPTKSIATAQ